MRCSLSFPPNLPILSTEFARTRVQTSTHTTRTHALTHSRTHAHAHTYTHRQTDTHRCTRPHKHAHTNTRTHEHTHTNTFTRTRTHDATIDVKFPLDLRLAPPSRSLPLSFSLLLSFSVLFLRVSRCVCLCSKSLARAPKCVPEHSACSHTTHAAQLGVQRVRRGHDRRHAARQHLRLRARMGAQRHVNSPYQQRTAPQFVHWTRLALVRACGARCGARCVFVSELCVGFKKRRRWRRRSGGGSQGERTQGGRGRGRSAGRRGCSFWDVRDGKEALQVGTLCRAAVCV